MRRHYAAEIIARTAALPQQQCKCNLFCKLLLVICVLCSLPYIWKWPLQHIQCIPPNSETKATTSPKDWWGDVSLVTCGTYFGIWIRRSQDNLTGNVPQLLPDGLTYRLYSCFLYDAIRWLTDCNVRLKTDKCIVTLINRAELSWGSVNERIEKKTQEHGNLSVNAVWN